MRLDELELEDSYFQEVNIEKETDNAQGVLEGYVTDDMDRVLNYFGDYTDVEQLAGRLNRYESIAVFKNVQVDGAKGQGLGTAVFSEGIEDAASSGAEAIILLADTYEENDFDLAQWYEGWGFETVDQTYQGPIMIMEV